MAKRGIPAHRRRLGNAIRKRRVGLGLSQEQLAERIDCHRNYVGNVERGEQNITIDMLVRFCRALGSSVLDIAEVSEI
jgi:transcriptional regulator with XRE-family HTH domain